MYRVDRVSIGFVGLGVRAEFPGLVWELAGWCVGRGGGGGGRRLCGSSGAFIL